MEKEYTETCTFEEIEKESLENEIRTQAILAYKKEERKRIQNLKFRFKQRIIIAAFAGFGLGIAVCKGSDLLKKISDYDIKIVIDKDCDNNLEEASKVNGKTNEEILGQTMLDYGKLSEENVLVKVK